MDFSNPEDHVIADDSMLFQTRNASISGGQMHVDTDGPAHFSPVWAGYPTGIPHGREGGLKPIDAGRFSRFVMRMNAPVAGSAIVRWFTCIEQADSCSGGHAFVTEPGWHTYDMLLTPNTPDPVLAQGFAGSVVGVRVILTGPGHYDVDWIRIGAGPADAGNGVDGLPPLGEIVGGAPPFPLPTDKLDYATYAGDAWDWSGRGDATPIDVTGVQILNGKFQGCNVPIKGDFGMSGLVFNLPGRLAIDANRFKTLTVEYSYRGPFSSKKGAGGGTVARVIWTNGAGRHRTKGIHLYPNEHVFQIRLDDPRTVFDGVDSGGGSGAPWEGMVTQFRIAPNQDSGARCFTIGRVWLTADEPAGASALTTTTRRPLGTRTLSPLTKAGKATTTTRVARGAPQVVATTTTSTTRPDRPF